jgi:toxin ParE1/3/4
LSSFRLTKKAFADLREIGQYTQKRWGRDQARSYVIQIRECCQLLAVQPGQGRLFNAGQPSIRRMEQGSHVIFYREQNNGILVSRILHKSMLPRFHLSE